MQAAGGGVGAASDQRKRGGADVRPDASWWRACWPIRLLQRLVARIPLGRIAEPEDVRMRCCFSLRARRISSPGRHYISTAESPPLNRTHYARRLIDLSMPVHNDMVSFPARRPAGDGDVRDVAAVRRADRRGQVRRGLADRALHDRDRRSHRHAYRFAAPHARQRARARRAFRSNTVTATAWCSTSAICRRAPASPSTT